MVGYYEGWAARRSCLSYRPRDIKPGVYSHLIFAFASIDTQTSEIIPAEAGDVELYRELTDLKKSDPGLKVYIAIGGWAFTEPWMPTKTAFSDLVASQARQRAFFKSLISFMATYNFDGVDLDWEYPGADDRSGREEDFKNFPIFVANLKEALASGAGSRTGLTLTLPVAYWYLRHFDIVKLQDSIEFFNMMSYDLHGTWDKGTNYTQPWLNSHTNLTEITDYFDLMWRNDIDPAKVVLGLAFYSRTFALADPGCTAVGGKCLFASGGKPGRCSNNVGTLMGSEVREILDANPSIQPTLDKDAAVKVFVHNGDWITFDDEATWRLKVKFAKSQCLGGVMVWAVSQDVNAVLPVKHKRRDQVLEARAVAGTYSEQLQRATGYNSPGFKDGKPDMRVVRGQCRWTGCGEPCGANYYPMYREDSDKHNSKEYMMDNTNCKSGGHLLCCPAYISDVHCGWYDFWNGKCGGNCPKGMTEVGSTRIACHTGKPQVACCNQKNHADNEIVALALYNNCHWEGGNSYPCDRSETDSCKDGTKLVASRMGSGGFWCATNKRRLDCCGPQSDDKKWDKCYWQERQPDSSGYCHPTCPYPEVRVAMEETPPGCSKGGWAYCCTPVYKTEAKSDDDKIDLYKAAFETYMKDPVCRYDNGATKLKVRDRVDSVELNDSHVTAVAKRQDQVVLHRDAQIIVPRLVQQVAMGVIADVVLRLQIESLVNAAWRQAVVTRNRNYEHMNTNALINFNKELGMNEREKALKDVSCDMDKLAEASTKTEEFTRTLACTYIWNTESDFTEDGDDGGDEEQDGRPNKRRLRRRRRRVHVPELDEYEPIPEPDESGNWPEVAEDGSVYPHEEMLHALYGRSTGAPRGYSVDAKRNDPAAPGPKFSVRSSEYWNGKDGDELIDRNKDSSRYLIESKGCGSNDYKLLNNAKKSDAPGKWVSEHILELQGFPRFLEAAISGKFKKPAMMNPGSPTSPITSTPINAIYPDIINTGWTGWTFPDSAAMIAMGVIGSTRESTTMVVCESALNAIKSRIFRFFRPVSAVAWANCCSSTTQKAAENAFSNLQRVYGVFDYYADANVKSKHRKAYNLVKQALSEFESAKPNAFPLPTLQTAWKQYMTNQANSMSAFARWWVTQHLTQLLATWNAEYFLALSAKDAQREYYARQTIDDLTDFQLKALLHFNIDTSIFT